uniref:Uncharacterized protein n=1 Tax=Rhizophora mucronata TaxID=61149 RepID=A0A2P2KJM9_RHIMU
MSVNQNHFQRSVIIWVNRLQRVNCWYTATVLQISAHGPHIWIHSMN